MYTKDLSKPISSAKLNENMFKKFGVKINLEKYDREQLENYRNLLRTKVHSAESKSNFNDLLTSETYQKDKYIIGILNQRIKEIVGESKVNERSLTTKEKKKKEEIVKAIKRDNPEKRSGKGKSSAYAIATAQAKKTAEGTEMKTSESKKAKPDFLDMDKDGNKKEPMKKAIKDKKATEAAEKTPSTWTDSSGKKHPATRVKGDKYTGKEAEKDEKKVKEEAEKTATTWTDKSGKKHPATRVKGKGYDGSAAEKEAKQKKVKESHKRNVKIVNEAIVRFITEDEEGKAKSITAGTDMVNDFTSWMTRVGQYQTKSMIELADAIRANFGQQEAETFKSSVQPALDAALQALTQAREEISNSVAVLAGEAPAQDPMGGMDDMGGGMPGEEGGMDDMGGDEFAGSDAAAGGMETPGREMREARRLFARKLAESHNLMRSLAK